MHRDNPEIGRIIFLENNSVDLSLWLPSQPVLIQQIFIHFDIVERRQGELRQEVGVGKERVAFLL